MRISHVRLKSGGSVLALLHGAILRYDQAPQSIVKKMMNYEAEIRPGDNITDEVIVRNSQC